MTPAWADRFWSKVNKTDTCWLWTAGKIFGYGVFEHRIERGVPRQVRAHRLSWELIRGPIPEGYELDHLCKIRNCVNPDHLEPVTQYVNNMRSDSPAAVAARRTECPHGHPYDEKNLHIDYRGNRKCRACDRLRAQARRDRKKAMANG